MGNLLFSPTGRINPSEFMRGALILIIVGFVLNALPAISFTLGSTLSLLGLVLIWCWIVLFVKRYHDGGKTGWMSIIPIVVFLVLSFIVSGIVSNVFAGDLNAEITQLTQEALSSGDSSNFLAATLGMGSEIAKKTAIPTAIAGAVISYGIAFIFNGMIKHDPQDNTYGPAA